LTIDYAYALWLTKENTCQAISITALLVLFAQVRRRWINDNRISDESGQRATIGGKNGRKDQYQFEPE